MTVLECVQYSLQSSDIAPPPALPRDIIFALSTVMDERFEFINDWSKWRREYMVEWPRVFALGEQLWGGGEIEGLQRQLARPSPEIPRDLDKDDLLALQKYLLTNKNPLMGRLAARVVTVGGEQFTLAEAMYEIVRRALAALGN